MDDETTSNSLTKSKMMENPTKQNKESKVKVKLKVPKKKVNLRRTNKFNRSNSSFNTSLNASMKMKKTLVSNNRALAEALQITKQDLGLASDLIANLQRENIELMKEKAEVKHTSFQDIDAQMNERLKPLLQMFKSKIREMSGHLTEVASSMKDLSSAVTSRQCTMSAENSRANSLEINHELYAMEANKMPTNEKSNSPKRRSSYCSFGVMRNAALPFNDLSLIAESSFLNLEQASNSVGVLDMVLENESEKFRDSSDTLQSTKDEKLPRRISVDTRRSRSRRDSKTRRRSMDEIDFGPNVTKKRRSRRSSIFRSTNNLENAACSERVSNGEIQDTPGDELDDKNIQTKEEGFSLLNENEDTIVISDPPLGGAPGFEINDQPSGKNQEQYAECNSPMLIEQGPPVSSQQGPQILAPSVPSEQEPQELAPPVSLQQEPQELPPQVSLPQGPQEFTPTVDFDSCDTDNPGPYFENEEINHTNVGEVDMELTNVIDASVRLDSVAAASPLVETSSAKRVEEPTSSASALAGGGGSTSSAVDPKVGEPKDDPAFVKPVRAAKKRTDSKKEETKVTKSTKEKEKEPMADLEDDGKAVIELRVPKPGKIIFSAVRKNPDGIRASPPKARSKKKLTAMKSQLTAAEPKNLFDFHDKTPQTLAKKPDPIETGIYDVSLNDSVYGTCQSLGEYRERVALAKRTSSVHPGGENRPSLSMVRSAVAEAGSSKGDEKTVIEAESDENKSRARSRKVPDGNEEKKKRCRSKKRVVDSDSDSDGKTDAPLRNPAPGGESEADKKKGRARSKKICEDGGAKIKRSRSKKRVVADSDCESDSDADKTYVRHYQNAVKSGDGEGSEREFTRRARSKVISYKEPESDFDLTLMDKQTPLKKTEPRPKEKSSDSEKASNAIKVGRKSSAKSCADDPDSGSKTSAKSERGRKSVKGAVERRARSRKRSMSEGEDAGALGGSASRNASPKQPDKEGTKGKEPSELQNLMNRLEKLQKKTSHTSQHPSAAKTEEKVEKSSEEAATAIKPVSTTEDIFERYKQALISSKSSGQRELKKGESSKSRSRPARIESSDKEMPENRQERARSLRVLKSSDITEEDKGKPLAKRKRSQSAVQNDAAKEHKIDDPCPSPRPRSSPCSPSTERGESPDPGLKSKATRSRSKSQAGLRTRSKSRSLRTRSTSAERKAEESPEVLQRKIRKDRGRSRSRAAIAQTDDSKLLNKENLEIDSAEPVKATQTKLIRERSIAGKELLLKLKSLVADDVKPTKASITKQDVNRDATRTSVEPPVPEILHKESKTSLGHSKQISKSSDVPPTNAPHRSSDVSPKKSLEKPLGKRSAEYTTIDDSEQKRPRRGTKPMSYKEPSLHKKLRQGDKIFGDNQKERISVGEGDLAKAGIDAELRKRRTTLENITNLNY